jgi:hypothetical protein
MKKAIIISAISLLLLLSCSNDDNATQPTICNCEKLAYQQVITYNPLTFKATFGPKIYTGGKSFYSKNCKDNGRYWTETTYSNGNNHLAICWEVKCK